MRRITRSMTKDASGDNDDMDAAASSSAAPRPHAEEDNLNGSSSNQMMTDSANTTQLNPLLMVDYLEKLFPYLNDRESLTSVRLVNKIWNHTSAPALKNAVTWHVGPNKTCEPIFLRTMSKLSVEERSRTFRNFELNHRRINMPKKWGFVGKHVDKFMQEFGPHMINLKIKSMDIDYVREHLKQTFLTNLEQLEFYDISQSVLTHPILFENTELFTKMNKLCFNPTTRDFRDWWADEEGYSEGEGRICFNMLKACPNLRQLEINLRRTTLKILRDVNSELNLTSLTSFKNSLRDNDYEDVQSTVIFRPLDFYTLVSKCPNLKVLSVNISQVASKTEICQMLAKYSAKLEELYISTVEEGYVRQYDSEREEGDKEGGKNHHDWSSSSEESEEEEEQKRQKVGKRKRKLMKSMEENMYKLKLKKVKKYGLSFPDFPLLKKLVILSWFYTDLDKLGSMPLLQEIEVRMKDGVDLQLGIQPTVSYPTVWRLKFRSASRDRDFRYFLPWGDDGRLGLEAPMVAPLISIFPNVTELDVELQDDIALRNLFRTLAGCAGGQLKRLHLNKSQISDSGMTGIQWTEQVKMEHDNNCLSMDDDFIENYRRYPFIGLLTGLQELTYKGNELTDLSVEFGLVSLQQLTSLRLPPHKRLENRRHYSWHSWDSEAHEDKSLVNVRALVNNLKYLVKLDVNDDNDMEVAERMRVRRGESECRPNPNQFKGCGISVVDLKYIKEHAPNLEIVYREINITP